MRKAEFYEFMREQTLRHERASRDMQRGLAALERRTEAEAVTLRELVEDSRAERAVLRDLVEESRAQRQALFRILDRLGPGPEPAAG